MITWTVNKRKRTAIGRDFSKEFNHTYVGRIQSITLGDTFTFAFYQRGRGHTPYIIKGCENIDEAIIVATTRLRFYESETL